MVSSPYWDNGETADVGAVTWGSGSSGISGAVSESNSLVGSQVSDAISIGSGVTALSNGNYVVVSDLWDNEDIPDAGAATWGSGSGGTTGAVSVTNSLVGSHIGDQVGSGSVTTLSNGNYVVRSPFGTKDGYRMQEQLLGETAAGEPSEWYR